MSEGQGHFEGKHGDSLADIHRYQRRTFAYIRSVLEYANPKPKFVLDIGASDGYLGEFFEANGMRYTGVDPQPRSPRVFKGTIRSDALISRVDLILLIHVLEHVENPYGEIAIVHDLLTPQGLVFIAVPDASAPWSWIYDGHKHIFNETILRRMLEKNKFIVWESLTITFREDKKELWMIAQKNSLS